VHTSVTGSCCLAINLPDRNQSIVVYGGFTKSQGMILYRSHGETASRRAGYPTFRGALRMWSVRSWPPHRIGYLIPEVHELSCLDSLLSSPYSQDERTDMAILSIIVLPVLPASATSAACCKAHKPLNIPAAATACAGCSSDFGKGKETPTPGRWRPGVALAVNRLQNTEMKRSSRE